MPAPKKAKDWLAGRTPDLQLYRAVRRYVESLGGSIVVIGGIEVQEWPGEPMGKYRVAVSVLGRKPPPISVSRSNDAR
jgi:hypothetical protein